MSQLIRSAATERRAVATLENKTLIRPKLADQMLIDKAPGLPAHAPPGFGPR